MSLIEDTKEKCPASIHEVLCGICAHGHIFYDKSSDAIQSS